MQLRSLTLSGFKTFANRTQIRFENGVTAIVGPNGSGKTNIVDGFRWVLGETQARDLRGTKMEEVIYAGGQRRAAASRAEVVLVIDNSSGRLPVDFREVEIRRQVDRSGGSDYYLNGSRVRRRDVIDLLGATGLVVDAYSIITQPDIDFIISCTPEQRRGLIEEAARIRGIKAKRSGAIERLRQLAQNMLRLQDLRLEIEPRREVVRAQADAARQAREAQSRLVLLRGSLAWEEWREARDTHRRVQSTVAGLERRREEARTEAEQVESAYQGERRRLQQAQDRRLQHQRQVSALTLELAQTQHEAELAAERSGYEGRQAEQARGEERELEAQLAGGMAQLSQLEAEREAAAAALAATPAPLDAPRLPDAELARQSRRVAEAKRQDANRLASQLASLHSRAQFMNQSLERLRADVEAAEAELPGAREAAERNEAEATAAAAAAAELARLRAERDGLAALDPAGGALPRLAEVLQPDPGYEIALSAALGPLADALVAPSEASARAAVGGAEQQTTVLYPRPAPPPEPGSLYAHVRFGPEYEPLARRFLGRVRVGEAALASVTVEGQYQHPGLQRAGADVRAQLLRRRRELDGRIAGLEAPAATAGEAQARALAAKSRRAELEAGAASRRQLESGLLELARMRAEETALSARLERAEADAAEAEAVAARRAEAVERGQAELAQRRAEAARWEMERARWQERRRDVERQVAAAQSEVKRLESALASRRRRAAEAQAKAEAAQAAIPGLALRLEEVGSRLAAVQAEPDRDEEVALLSRSLLGLEEARVDARLKLTTLEGNLNLLLREAELAQARMDDLRTRMPEGMAPEEVPGGKAREREMRALERLLEQLGPTNPLAETEYAELEQRYSGLLTQLEDLEAARSDLEQLIEKLREQEESRYEAVFGAVATHFQEYFGELSGGGKATLRNVRTEGGSPGLEILVQPPRKRLQSVSLLSSGERALTALALMLALQRVNPSPFVILDEVDAALDDANVERFGEALERLGQERQFLVVTHNHATMARAAALYGVHLDESGTSHLVSVRLGEVGREQPASAATA